MQPSIFTMLTALVAVVIGTAGFVLSVLNYFRDRPKVIVTLGWDYVTTADPTKRWGVVRVTNVGRRPIFISHANLTYPNSTVRVLILESAEGTKLLEGDPPKRYLLDIKEGFPSLEPYAAQWWKVRACVEDHTGKYWWSSKLTQKPKWGSGPPPTRWQWLRYRLITEAPIIRSIHIRSIVRKHRRTTESP
jgi:hypothetical protein